MKIGNILSFQMSGWGVPGITYIGFAEIIEIHEDYVIGNIIFGSGLRIIFSNFEVTQLTKEELNDHK